MLEDVCTALDVVFETEPRIAPEAEDVCFEDVSLEDDLLSETIVACDNDTVEVVALTDRLGALPFVGTKDV